MSSYNYAFDNPVTLTDPIGLAPDDIILRGTNGKTFRIKTAREDVTTIDVPVALQESGTATFRDFSETPENFAVGVQVAISGTQTAYTGTSQEAYVQALSFEPGKTSFFSGTDTAAQGGNSIEVSALVSASAVVVLKDGNGPAKPEEYSGAYGFSGSSGSADLGGIGVGGEVEVSRGRRGEYTTIEAGAFISGPVNLPGFTSPGPFGVVEGVGAEALFSKLYPLV